MEQLERTNAQQTSRSKSNRRYQCDRCPSFRVTVRTLVLLYSCTCITLLTWLALSRESLPSPLEEQTRLLILSLYITTPVSMTMTVVLFHIDWNKPPTPPDGRQSKALSGIADTGSDILRPNDSSRHSTSFKTVLTINSGIPTVKDPGPPDQEVPVPPPSLVFSPPQVASSTPDNFVNFTPDKSKPITIVDLKSEVPSSHYEQRPKAQTKKGGKKTKMSK